MMPFPGPLIATQFARQTGRPEYVYYEIVGPFESAQVRTRHPEALSPYTKSATHLRPFPVNARHASTVCYHAC